MLQVYNKYTIYICISIIFNKFYQVLVYIRIHNTKKMKNRFDSRFDSYDIEDD
jgi:hypothetical protein